MERRRFLRNLTAGLSALPLLPTLRQELNDGLRQLAADVDASATSEALWRRVREEFQLDPGFSHLNCGSLGATPRLVTDAVSATVRDVEGDPANSTFGWGGRQMEEVRARAAQFLGADIDEIAITRNTTEGMNAVVEGIDFAPGDQVLTTNHEHGGGMVCWQHARRHRGIEMVYMEMPRQVESKQQILDLVSAHITPRTKACSFSHIDTITGVQMPMAKIAALTRPRDILLVCDGAQAPGMIGVDVHALGVDTYALSGHKWMLAPKGSGMLYIRKAVQERVHPALLHSGYSAYSASSGTRDVAHVMGQRITMEFHDAIGRERIEARCRQLIAYFRAQLEDIPGVLPMTPAAAELCGAMLTCTVASGSAGEVKRRLLEEYQILVKLAQPTYAYSEEPGIEQHNYNALRLSTHIFNSEAEIDRAADALRRILA